MPREYRTGCKVRRINFTNREVASSETARNINRSVVLNLIRRRQPISRADLARVSGLQRSTVSLITEQLMREKWIVYGPVGRLPRGRRPTYLRLNDRRAIIVADLRPLQTTVGIADVNGNFLALEPMNTPSSAAKMASQLATRIRQLMHSHGGLVFEGIGISLPGRFDQSKQRVIFAPNLRWNEFELGKTIEESTGLPVDLENAANACVLAEMWFGHSEHIHDLVVVTISEGIGTGIFANGHLVRGFNGMAGEFGHASLDPDGPLCTCGGRGCWEVFASNRAALRYYNDAGKSSEGMTFQDLMTLSESGDALALRALDRMAHAIGRGMRMIVAGLAPQEIVVVGEFTRQWPRFGPVIESEVSVSVLVGKPPRIRPAIDPRTARLRGTVALVLQKHFGPSAQEEVTTFSGTEEEVQRPLTN